MDEATAALLHDVNRRFYHERAEDFDTTRGSPWRGWRRLLEPLPSDLEPDNEGRFRVLDVGCGNGRLALFLEAERGRDAFSYVGLDSSLPLLALARRRLPGRCRLLAADAVGESGLAPIRPASLSLVAAFGLLHHVAGFTRRRALIQAMARLLRPGGMLWLSFWQFAREERFARRRVPWEEYNLSTTRPIDATRLETGDALLRWGEEELGAVRYCHFSDREEALHLARDVDLELVDLFEDDGREGNLNLYLALRRP